MKPTFTRLILAAMLFIGGLAHAQAPLNYTFLPNGNVFILPETQQGVAHFTLTNLRQDSPLTVSGYRSRADFIRRTDPLDDFEHEILGPALSYEVAPGGTQDIPVLITPDLIGGDPNEELPGHWNLIVRPTVRLGSLDNATLPQLPIVNGRVRALRVVITDVPVPEAQTWALVLGGLGLVVVAARRRPGSTYFCRPISTRRFSPENGLDVFFRSLVPTPTEASSEASTPCSTR